MTAAVRYSALIRAKAQADLYKGRGCAPDVKCLMKKAACLTTRYPIKPSGTATYHGTNQTISKPQMIAKVTKIPAILLISGSRGSAPIKKARDGVQARHDYTVAAQR